MRVRVTGKVLLKEDLSFGSGEREFKFQEMSIQTGVASIEKIRLDRDFKGDVPRVNEVVDLEVEVSAYTGKSGTRVTLTAKGIYDPGFAYGLPEPVAV